MNTAMARIARARQAMGDANVQPPAPSRAPAPGSWESDAAALQQRYPNRAELYQATAGAQALDGVLPAAAAMGGYQAPNGAVPRINATRLYQQEGRGSLAGYASNPLEEEGRRAIARQFLSAPIGGHIRAALQGQEMFGHTITNGQARMAEQGLAGLIAGGVGTAGLLAAIDGLNGPDQTPGTIPIY